MANVKISGFPVPFALPAAATLTGTEEVPMDQVTGGVRTTVAATTAAIAALASGGSLTITDGTHSVTPTTTITFNGATVSGTTPNGIVTISGGNSSAFSQAYSLLGDFDGVPDDPWPAMFPSVYPGNSLTVNGLLSIGPSAPVPAADNPTHTIQFMPGTNQAFIGYLPSTDEFDIVSPIIRMWSGITPVNTIAISSGQVITLTGNTIMNAGNYFGIALQVNNANHAAANGIQINAGDGTTGSYVLQMFNGGGGAIGEIYSSGAFALNTSPLVASQTQVMTGLVGLRNSSNNITSSTTLTADAQLQVTFNETGTYAIEGYLAFYEATLGTGGFQFDLGAGTATTGSINWAADGYITALTGNPATTSTTTAQSYSTISTSSTAPSFVNISGSVTISAVGTFGVRVAQVVSSANATTVQANSYIMFTKI
jgi:hypothetical protein